MIAPPKFPSEVTKSFEEGKLASATDEELVAWLTTLCTVRIQADFNRGLAENQCRTINALLTTRLIARIDAQNRSIGRLTTVLAIVGVLVAAAELIAG